VGSEIPPRYLTRLNHAATAIKNCPAHLYAHSRWTFLCAGWQIEPEPPKTPPVQTKSSSEPDFPCILKRDQARERIAIETMANIMPISFIKVKRSPTAKP